MSFTSPYLEGGRLVDDLNQALSDRIPFKDVASGAEIVAEVYPLVLLPDFVREFGDLSAQITVSKGEALGLPYREKRNDLYRFSQTGDLSGTTVSNSSVKVVQLKNLFTSEAFVAFVERLVGRPLSRRTIDLSSQRYSAGDYLLPHDDRLDSRRVALVYYVVGPEQGGSLDFFPTDWRATPTARLGRQSYFPRISNCLALFPVSMSSHHQVAQVVKGLRVSVAGWLHDAEADQLHIKVPRISADPPAFINPGHSVESINMDGPNHAIIIKNAFHLDWIDSIILYRQTHPSEQIYTVQESFFYIPTKGEPSWMRSFMSPAFHRFISHKISRSLDWPTRPILKFYTGLNCFKKLFEPTCRLHETGEDAELVRIFALLEENALYICFNGDLLAISPGDEKTTVYTEYSLL